MATGALLAVTAAGTYYTSRQQAKAQERAQRQQAAQLQKVLDSRPDPRDQAKAEAAAKTRVAQAQAARAANSGGSGGQNGTILTSPLGVSAPRSSQAQRTILGA